MASSKTRAKNRPASAKAARTTAAVAATPTTTRKPASPAPARPASARPAAAQGAKPAPAPRELRVDEAPAVAIPDGPPLWLQIVSFVLAILGLAISAYETYAHFNGSHLLGCSGKAGGTFDCTAVITSPQSMVFGVIPVAILGLAFYVFAIVIFSPWAWRIRRREVNLVRLGSMIVGMGFVIYLIYAEIVQIGAACEYCSAVHALTFVLFCITVFSAALWGLGPRTAK